MTIRSALYRIARLMGDINAIARGRYLQRLVRKMALRKSAGIINRIIK